MNKQLFYFLLAVISTVCLLSCGSATRKAAKATKHYSKAKRVDKPTVAILARTDFPCIVTSNDTINKTDTLWDWQEIMVDCPDNAQEIQAAIKAALDARDKGETYIPAQKPTQQTPAKVPIMRIRETITNTIRIKDSADVYLADYSKNEALKKLERVQDKLKVRTQFMWLFLLLFLTLLTWNFRRQILFITKRLIIPV